MGTENETNTKKMGRPSLYHTLVAPRLDDVRYWSRTGVYEKDMAERLGVARQTFVEYKQLFPDLADALKERDVADRNVVNAIYKSALGYNYTETTRELKPVRDDNGKIIGSAMVVTKEVKKHVPPQYVAGFFWAKNRLKQDWQDKVEHDLNAGGPLRIVFVDSEKEKQQAAVGELADAGVVDI